MQKRRYLLQIFILISISIYPGKSRYGNAQVEQDNPYLEFKQLLQNEQNAKAAEMGHGLFESLVSKYPGNVSLCDIQRRLKVAHDVTELISQGLESKQKKAIEDIVGLDILPELPPIGRQKEKSANILPIAEHLYWTHLESFSREPNIQGVSAAESKFLHEYYDLKMQSWIEKVAKITTQMIINNPESMGLPYYSFVLPLLYLNEEDPTWADSDFLFAVIGSDNLDLMSDFCLLRVDRPKTATAVAKYKAKSRSRSFSLVDWSLTAGTKCLKNHRPDLAEKLLNEAINDLSDRDKAVELRLKIAEGYGKCGDNTTATKRCKQIVEDCADSSLYGKVTSFYFVYLARQSKAAEILLEIDSSLDSPQCQGYLPQLMYLKWWALRKTNKQILADKIGEQLIENYGNNPCIAPVLLAQATDALSNQRYNQCQKLLVQLARNFPQTNSAKQARKILDRLGKR